jgi:hypothetical protein
VKNDLKVLENLEATVMNLLGAKAVSA